ncbi:MAG: PKD domain-containing protein [Candidatus Thermoplasmatota archaeon]|nr:PKD domain-containing protein [Candidatus Thermoplasmatota archaeon]
MNVNFSSKVATALILVIITALISTNATVALTNSDYSGELNVSIPINSYQHAIDGFMDTFAINEFGRLLVPGKPNLPSKIFTIAVPSESTVQSVSFIYEDPQQLEGSYKISPAPLPRVIGNENPNIYEEHQQTYQQNYQSVYTLNQHYPTEIGEYLGIAGYREFKLVEVRINPLRYNPVTQTILFYPEVNVHIDYSLPKSGTFIKETSPRASQRAEDFVLNFKEAMNWYPVTSPRGANDYVIITLDSLTSAVNSLKNWEQSKGKSVQVVTTSDINTQYTGYDLQEKIRNFLRENYPSSAWGIHDVLFVGDYNDVPMRRTAQNLGYGSPETDFYYAELTLPDSQSWDADSDHQYGENSDPIDYYGEVNVGRIPWSDPAIVQHICEKSVAYEQNNDPDFKKNILLLAAFFWPDTDNAVLMETKIDQPWMTDWTKTRLYEQGQSTYPMDNNLDYTNVQSYWSQGTFAFVNWAGHGSPTACYEYYPSQPFVDTATCDNLNDDYPAIIFADACSNSDTDYLNIGKAMLNKGGVGFLGSTKVALGCPGWNDPMDGSSQSLDYYFTTYVTSTDYSQGEAHQKALTDMYTYGLWSYNKYETFEWGALWGNPGLGMGIMSQNNQPEKPIAPTGPTQCTVGTTYEFTAVGTDPDSDDLYYKWDWGDGINTDWEGPYPSGIPVVGNHSWYGGGAYEVKVKVKDPFGAMSEWSDPLLLNVGIPLLTIASPSSGIGPIQFTLTNIGDANAALVRWTIMVRGGFLGLITDQEFATIDTLDIDETVSITCKQSYFGLGPLAITIDASAQYTPATTEQIQAFIIGPFILVR